MNCLECDKSLENSKNKFCDRSCAATYNNRKRPKKRNSCTYCGQDTKNKVYCSNGCQAKHTQQKIYEQIEAGEYKVITGTNTLRKYLLESRGEVCECCGNSEWLGEKIPLNVHHIDGDAANNKLENLEVLCLNCHGLTDNYGSKNKNSARVYRYNK